MTLVFISYVYSDIVGLINFVDPNEACVAEGWQYDLLIYPSGSGWTEPPFLCYVVPAHVEKFGGCFAFVLDM